MPTDANENSSSSTSMTTNTDNHNNGGSSIDIHSPPLVSLPQTSSTNRSDSPSQMISKQLDKLRRFLSTLFYFGSDISDEIGERVRALILALVNNALSIEEFHGKLQATTNFPLRPFALPFLKSTLPLLQKDLLQQSRQSKQSTSQYLAQHEDFLFLSRDLLENDLSPTREQINENGKRNFSDEIHSLTTKRPAINSRLFNNPILYRDKERTFSSYLHEYTTDYKEFDESWKHAENMLNSILEMVTKSKRVLFMLQQRDLQNCRLIETNDLEWRRRHAELLTQTDERIAEVRRKAEEAVLEIKRQSIIDLQKAISQTEQKSNEILHHEREQYQRLKNQIYEEIYSLLNRQDDGPENCWHCGRKAIETCSVCNFARYCGQYCQHRDWDIHQKICNSDLKSKYQENPHLYRQSSSKTSISRSSSISPPTMTNNHNSPELTIIKSESN